ncbi:hypothetical protein GCM10023214_70990 [Amycolatopsis dongchuanensis]|uniref:Uncharacterized protein n=1 Tax=Amycolatopsis dongchuanensis TaxID=1070866 RepID=A0ABP8VMS6_9PSEU
MLAAPWRRLHIGQARDDSGERVKTGTAAGRRRTQNRTSSGNHDVPPRGVKKYFRQNADPVQRTRRRPPKLLLAARSQ